jgi:hypothetical protein
LDNCNCCGKDHNGQFMQKLKNVETEMVDVAKRFLKSASDPFSGVISFLHERPENTSMPGYLINGILLDCFGSQENIPGLIRILSSHVKEICRHSNMIELINEHSSAEKWGNFVIKQKERIKFEVSRERGLMVLKNIHGLIGVEHGIELPLEKILVEPPKLIVTVKMGLLHPQRVVDI